MIISIDPGVTNCGVSRLEMKGDKLHILETHNVTGNRKLKGDLKEIADKYGDRTGKIIRILNVIKEILDTHPNIKTIVVEAPFFNSRMPNAFKSLLEVVIPIQYEIAMPRDLEIVLIAPKEAKFFWAGKGNARGKEAMSKAFEDKLKNGEIVFKTTYDKLTEHEIDSYAIGYSHFKLKDIRNEKGN